MLLLATCGARDLFAAAQGKTATFISAGYKLRQEVRQSANNIKRLDGQLKSTKSRAAKAEPVLDDIHRMLTGDGGGGGLWGDLLAADRKLEEGLKDLLKLPVHCDGAKLREWESSFEAERKIAEALRNLARLQAETVRIKRSEAMLKPVYTALSKDRQDAQALLAARVLNAYMQEHAQVLDATAKRLAAALRAPDFSRVGRLAEQSRERACAKELAVKPKSAPPQTASFAPIPATVTGGVAGVRTPALSASPQEAQAGRAAPEAKKPSFLGKIGDFFKKAAKDSWDWLKEKTAPIADNLKSAWNRYKPLWLWKDKKDLSWADNNLSWKKIDGDLYIKGKGDANAIDYNDVNQGGLGDCYYLAAMAAVARQKPAVIENMFKENENGTFSVTYKDKRPWWKFWAPKYTEKTVTVDNEFPAYNYGGPAFAQYGDSENGKPELWTMVGEKAYASFKGKDLYARIEGGFANKAMEQITGVDSKKYAAKKVTLAQLAEWDKNGYALTIHTKTGLFTGGDPLYENNTIYPSHAYYIKEIDEKAGTVTLGNPWGYKHATLTIEQFQNSLNNVHVNTID